MPVTNTQQARIDMSRKQAEAVVDLISEARAAPMFSLEETNIAGCIAFITKANTVLVHHDGSTHNLGAAVQSAKMPIRR